MSESIPGGVGIPHVFLRVSEMERSVRFYEALFGLPVHKQRENYAAFHLREPALHLKLLESRILPVPAPAYRSLSMPAAEDVAATKDRLIAHGIATFDRPGATCCAARGDAIWAHDPDGNGWEVHTEADKIDTHDALGQESTEAVVRRCGAQEPLLPADDSCCSFPDAC